MACPHATSLACSRSPVRERLLDEHANREQAQTPQQKKANAKFSNINEKKMGKPLTAIKKKEQFKSPIGPVWLALLGFVVFGGLIFEVISRIFFR